MPPIQGLKVLFTGFGGDPFSTNMPPPQGLKGIFLKNVPYSGYERSWKNFQQIYKQLADCQIPYWKNGKIEFDPPIDITGQANSADTKSRVAD